MRSYFGLFKMTFKGELQYRAKAISGLATQFFWGLMYIFLFTAFMKNKEVNGFTLSQMASYIWLGQAFFAMKWIKLPGSVGRTIVNGDVCYNFIRPMNLYNQWFAQGFGEKLSSTMLRCGPVILMTLFIPKIGLSLPVSVAAFFLFLLALVLAAIMSMAISMIATYLTLVTLSEKGMANIVNLVTSLFCGTLIPLPLLPESLQRVITYLPFRVVGDLPFRIYIGNISIQQSLIQIAIAAAWVVVMVVIGKVGFKLSLKKTTIQGG